MKHLISLTLAVIFFSLIPKFVLSQTFTPGVSYFDSSGYVEYRAGNLPIIISAPHGGDLSPDSIPDRNCSGCVTEKDSWTKQIAEGVYNAIYTHTGCFPHLVVNLLHRKKLDANRDIDEAANGNHWVEEAWYAYHEFIDSAKAKSVANYKRGLFLDIHAHAHNIQRIELGYLLSGEELRLNDSILNETDFIEKSSIRTLADDNIQSQTLTELLRGENSFGTLLMNRGFPSVPGSSDPFPQEGQRFFSGGYNTKRHGSRDNNGTVDAIQLELNADARKIDSLRVRLIDSLALVVLNYYNLHYNDLDFISK